MAKRDTGPPEWTFDNATELAEWRDSHDLSATPSIVKVKTANGTERSILKITSTGDNPYIYPGGSVPSWEPFSGYENNYIYIGVRVEKSDVWTVDYITGKNSEYSNEQSRRFNINASQDFQDIRLDMQWDGIIKGFRIHFGTGRNKITEIDYLSLRGQVEATQTPRKLSTTWGRVKDLF